MTNASPVPDVPRIYQGELCLERLLFYLESGWLDKYTYLFLEFRKHRSNSFELSHSTISASEPNKVNKRPECFFFKVSYVNSESRTIQER